MIGLKYRPSRLSVIASNNSSSVPQPPGNAITASEPVSNLCLRSRMSSTRSRWVSPGMAPLEVGHEARQDADDFAALGQGAIGQRTHQALRAAAIDDRAVAAGQDFAERARRGVELGRGLRTGGRVNADSHYSTVTDLARLRGWSTSVPRNTAMWYASSCSGIVDTTGAA